ncbi:MAG: hypothetical protein KatS3mg127_1258 [Silanimonas sp.]|nr:MAG: hypothetical protein KatS3mg127_1258 [Silanimonas sp.]
MSQYISILTTVGQQRVAAALAGGPQVQITHMAVGDGNGAAITPHQGMTGLVHEVHRAPLSSLSVHPANPNWLRAELIIPGDVGGWTIREVGLIGHDGALLAVAQFPPTTKPVLADNVVGEARLRVTIPVSSAAAVKLVVDPSLVYATAEYVDGALGAHAAAADPHPGYLRRGEIAVQRIAPASTLELSLGGTYIVDSAATARALRLPAIPADPLKWVPIYVQRRGANFVDISRATGTDTVEGAAEDVRMDEDFQILIFAPGSATDWHILNRRQ